MPGPFETAARAAIEELIQSHGRPSKFGVVLTHDGTQGLIDALYDLLATSRNLKAAGDRMLTGNAGSASRSESKMSSMRPRYR